MRRRRKFKGTWFPINGAPDLQGQAELINSTSIENLGQITLNPNNACITQICALVPDEPVEDSTFEHLEDIVGQEYALRRIVGKLAIHANGATETYTPCKFAAGFFIARAGDTDASGAAYPIQVADGSNIDSSASTEEEESTLQYSPMAARTTRLPWIWRRTWLLAPLVGEAGQTGNLGPLPPYNGDYGSVLDGPHIDAKTRRRIRQDERLFFAISGQNTVSGGDENPEFNIDLDIRLFGAMRKARNQGAF